MQDFQKSFKLFKCSGLTPDNDQFPAQGCNLFIFFKFTMEGFSFSGLCRQEININVTFPITCGKLYKINFLFCKVLYILCVF